MTERQNSRPSIQVSIVGGSGYTRRRAAAPAAGHPQVERQAGHLALAPGRVSSTRYIPICASAHS